MALLNYPKFKAFSTSGLPLSGGLLNTYAAGSAGATPQYAYSDSACTVQLPNPVVLDINGEAVIYLKGAYYLVLTDSNDNQLWTMDNVQGINAAAIANIESYGGSLNTAISTIGNNIATILIDEQTTLTGNTTVPSNIGLFFVNGGLINLNGFNLRIAGPFDVAGRFQIFSGTGDITFANINQVYLPLDPMWFGGGASGVVIANSTFGVIAPLALNASVSDVSSAEPMYQTLNSQATTITNFENGLIGQSFDLIFNDAYTSVTFGTNILGASGQTGTVLMTKGTCIRFSYDGTVWHAIWAQSGPQGATGPAGPAVFTTFSQPTIASGTIYQNSGSGPIMINVEASIPQGSMSALIGSSSPPSNTVDGAQSTGAYDVRTLHFIVPAGWYWQVTCSGTILNTAQWT